MLTYVERIVPMIKIKFQTTMLKPSLRNYSDAYILIKETITVRN